jgi:hypothetical protein
VKALGQDMLDAQGVVRGQYGWGRVIKSNTETLCGTSRPL